MTKSLKPKVLIYKEIRNGLDVMFSQKSSVIFIFLTIMKIDQSDFWMNVLKSCVNSNLWKTDLIFSMVRNS